MSQNYYWRKLQLTPYKIAKTKVHAPYWSNSLIQ